MDLLGRMSEDMQKTEGEDQEEDERSVDRVEENIDRFECGRSNIRIPY